MEKIELDVQWSDDIVESTRNSEHPDISMLVEWVGVVLDFIDRSQHVSVSIRVVDDAEMAALNFRYRAMEGTTNVLSFPCDLEDETGRKLLGDLVISQPRLVDESRDQDKRLIHHWAHMVMHGVLHLLGYDHETDEQAAVMENIEVTCLATLGIDNPYLSNV